MNELNVDQRDLITLARHTLEMYSNRTTPFQQHICIVGPSRSGKDYLARYLYYNTSLQYNGTCSLAALPYVNMALSRLGFNFTLEELYNIRHQYKLFFFEFLNALRSVQPDIVPKLALVKSDLLVGVRDFEEYKLSLVDGRVTFWLESDVPEDSTMSFGWKDIQDFDRVFKIENNGRNLNYCRTVIDLLQKLDYPFKEEMKHPRDLVLKRNGIWLT